MPKINGFSESNLKKIKANLDKKERDKARREVPAAQAKGPVNSRLLKDTNNSVLLCSRCKKVTAEGNYVKADGGKTIICRRCFKKLF